jgi:hypothetical protein
MSAFLHSGRRFTSVKEISGPLLFLENISGVGYGELVEVTTPLGEERTAQVIDVSEEIIIVQLFEGTSGLDIGTTSVRFTGETIKLPEMAAQSYFPKITGTSMALLLIRIHDHIQRTSFRLDFLLSTA